MFPACWVAGNIAFIRSILVVALIVLTYHLWQLRGDLSVARATAVLRVLLEDGFDPSRISAAGYAERAAATGSSRNSTWAMPASRRQASRIVWARLSRSGWRSLNDTGRP